MASSQKHTLSLQEKYELLKCYEEKKFNAKLLTIKFKCGKTQVYQILKNKESIKQEFLSGAGNSNAKRKLRQTGNEDINKILLEWFLDARTRNLPISGPILQTQAKIIAKRLQKNDFKASNGWLECFCKRHGISHKHICGEAKDVNNETVAEWKNKLQDMIKDYEPCDIANCDETGLFFRALPSKTLALKSDKCIGGKQSKERLIVLVCGFADGKLEKPLVIGKSLKPRCFKNLYVRDLPVEWRANKKAWMTSSLMNDWLVDLNEKMRQQKRKIIMFLDNAACHPHLTLSNIKLCFFPPNSTSITQPMDQGVIQNLKLHYRRHVLKSLVQNMSQSRSVSDLAKQISILDAVRWIASVVKEVQRSCVVKCFRKAGFNLENTANEDFPENNEELLRDIEYLIKAAGEEGTTAEDFVSVDRELITEGGHQTIDTLIDLAVESEEEENNDVEAEGLGKQK